MHLSGSYISTFFTVKSKWVLIADKYIGKPVYLPVLKYCYREHEYKKLESNKVHPKGSKREKIVVIKVGIECKMVNS